MKFTLMLSRWSSHFELTTCYYDYGARFYDAQIGRFTTQDRFAEKYFDYGPYQYCMGNPIRFIDMNGDSVRLTKSFQDNLNLMKAHKIWLNTDAGKQFMKLFDVGGEYERIAVVFDAVDQNTLPYFGDVGSERLDLINSEGVPTYIGDGPVSKEVMDAARGKSKNSYIRSTLKFANTAYEADNNKAEVIDTQTHEDQHTIISISSILRSNKMPSTDEQHDLMNNKSGQYYKARFNSFMQVRTLWNGTYLYENQKNKIDVVKYVEERVRAH